MLVIDTGIAIRAALANRLDVGIPTAKLFAPPLLWSEARSVLHETAWRGELDVAHATKAHERLTDLHVTRREPERLGAEAWLIADELGLAKTYDAEFLALARLLGCRLVTADERLRRGTRRLGFVIGPQELEDLPD
ncbi:hypothetical protein BH23ACT10_BH23ACT10_02320 [soil metagenome]